MNESRLTLGTRIDRLAAFLDRYEMYDNDRTVVVGVGLTFGDLRGIAKALKEKTGKEL